MGKRVAEDLTGRHYTRLRVLRRDFTKKATSWWCLCDPELGGCGKETSVPAGSLRDENTRSCGCLKRDVSIAKARHGHARKSLHNRHSVEYATWCSMFERCYNDKGKAWPRYGGRGVYVCQRWHESFDNFLADMGLRPIGRYSIDRINNDGSYTCGRCDDCIAKGAIFNCRWATRSQQMRNTSVNHVVDFHGDTLPLIELTDASGISTETVKARLKKGIDIDTALTLPPDKKRWHKRYEFNGQTLTLAEWETVTGIPRLTLHSRMAAKWSIEHALTLPVVPGKRAKRWGHGRYAGLVAPATTPLLGAAANDSTSAPEAAEKGAA